MQISQIPRVMRTGAMKMPEKIKSGEADLTHAAGKGGGSLPEAYVQQIREQAKKDFATGVYMTEDFCNMQKSYLAKNVSPNRAAAIARVSGYMNRLTRPTVEGYVPDLFDMLFTAKVHKGLTRTTAAIYNEQGEMIAGYHSDNGYWQSVPTQAEERCWMDATQVYFSAWQQERAAEGSFSALV